MGPLTGPRPHVVRSLDDLMSWAHDALSSLARACGRRILLDIHKAFADTTYTTAFSGVDAPGTAANVIGATLNDMVGHHAGRLDPMRHLASTELLEECNRELELEAPSRPAPEHMFCDIEDFWNPSLRQQILNAQRIPFSTFESIIKKPGCVHLVA
eukprot:1245291-Pyramimonas_sp.AAC.1